MAEKTEKLPIIRKNPEKPQNESEKKLPTQNGVEKASVQKRKKLEESKEKIKVIREKKKQESEVTREKKDITQKLDEASRGYDMGAGKPPKKTENFVESPETKDKKEEMEKAEKETLQALKEKHETEMQEALENIDFDSMEPENRRAIHANALVRSVKMINVSNKIK